MTLDKKTLEALMRCAQSSIPINSLETKDLCEHLGYHNFKSLYICNRLKDKYNCEKDSATSAAFASANYCNINLLLAFHIEKLKRNETS